MLLLGSTNTSSRSGEDALMRANNDVTDALRRTVNLMQGELEKSVLSVQILSQDFCRCFPYIILTYYLTDDSTAMLKGTSETHDTLTNLMGVSKQLITALEKSDWIDKMLIIAALGFFFLVVLFILKERILDRGLRVAFWWTKYLPGLGRKSVAATKAVKTVLPSATTSSQSMKTFVSTEKTLSTAISSVTSSMESIVEPLTSSIVETSPSSLSPTVEVTTDIIASASPGPHVEL
jgi:protein transport protein SEC20